MQEGNDKFYQGGPKATVMPDNYKPSRKGAAKKLANLKNRAQPASRAVGGISKKGAALVTPVYREMGM